MKEMPDGSSSIFINVLQTHLRYNRLQVVIIPLELRWSVEASLPLVIIVMTVIFQLVYNKT